LGESSGAEDRSRSTQCDRYAEHTMEHGSLKFFWAVSEDETGVSWLRGCSRYSAARLPTQPPSQQPKSVLLSSAQDGAGAWSGFQY
jgi:hypothetical protein